MITSAWILSLGCNESESQNHAGKTDYFCEKKIILLYYSVLTLRTLSVWYLHQRSMLNRLRSKKLKLFEIL